jgi:glyoxylase-like metal-dependent hydrolase (beta-lactamase superfamily II)
VRLAEGLYRVDGVRGANVYLVESCDGLVVVDAGLPGNAERIVAFVRSIGRDPGDIHTIAVTHSDPDHIGSVARLKQLSGARVAIHADDAPTLAGTDRGKKPKGAFGVVLTMLAPFMRVEPVEADIILSGGDTLAGFTVMHTPGHTRGSVTLHRDGLVFSGDALLSDSAGRARPPSKALSADYEQALRSASAIEALGYRVLLTGHGQPVFADED